MSIKPEYAPATTEMPDVIDWARRNSEALATVLNDGMERLRLTVLHAEPERPRDGDVVYADGTDWNPGAGEGFYGRQNGAWVKL